MKRFAINFFPAFIILAFFSCDELDNLADISFNSTLEKTLSVVVVSTNEMTTSIELDATTADSEILKYADKIKNYEVTELLFAIENYNDVTEDEIYFDGTIGFSDLTDNQASSTCSISPLNVTHFDGTGNFPVTACTALINEISDVFTANNGVKLYMTGTFTDAPLEFDLKVTVTVKITANPL